MFNFMKYLTPVWFQRQGEIENCQGCNILKGNSFLFAYLSSKNPQKSFA